ncbi:MAG: hypothetical protein GY803_28020, partial [Chloroflexi bacterium]|nr:hypothetical protein [Chloroflexota bacterium]
MFILMAAFAPVLAPQPDPLWDTKLIPRDGFKAEPQPPGSAWKKAAPETVPGWYKTSAPLLVFGSIGALFLAAGGVWLWR